MSELFDEKAPVGQNEQKLQKSVKPEVFYGCKDT